MFVSSESFNKMSRALPMFWESLMMLSLVTDKRESASFWKPRKEMCYRNESNMWAGSSLSPPGSCKVPYSPLYLGLLHSLPAKTNLAFSWGRYEMAGKKNQSKFVASFPEKVYEHPHPECALACSWCCWSFWGCWDFQRTPATMSRCWEVTVVKSLQQ